MYSDIVVNYALVSRQDDLIRTSTSSVWRRTGIKRAGE